MYLFRLALIGLCLLSVSQFGLSHQPPTRVRGAKKVESNFHQPIGIKKFSPARESNEFGLKTHQQIGERRTSKFRREVLHILKVLRERELGHP